MGSNKVNLKNVRLSRMNPTIVQIEVPQQMIITKMLSVAIKE